MGNKSLMFVEKIRDYAHDNPVFDLSFINIGEFDKDFSDACDFWRLHMAIH
ncbi:MAG: hypothetical protein LBJ41_07860 [Treponema sp.]|nr:hypothetical protein [Treponema sp.]